MGRVILTVLKETVFFTIRWHYGKNREKAYEDLVVKGGSFAAGVIGSI